jgi:hypothetical protein
MFYGHSICVRTAHSLSASVHSRSIVTSYSDILSIVLELVGGKICSSLICRKAMGAYRCLQDGHIVPEGLTGDSWRLLICDKTGYRQITPHFPL